MTYHTQMKRITRNAKNVTEKTHVALLSFLRDALQLLTGEPLNILNVATETSSEN